MEWFNTTAAGASILGVILGVVTWVVSHRTNRLIADGHARTQAMIQDSEARTQALMARIHSETLATLDRMDERAEERHREGRP
jgi:hypothetical protein